MEIKEKLKIIFIYSHYKIIISDKSDQENGIEYGDMYYLEPRIWLKLIANIVKGTFFLSKEDYNKLIYYFKLGLKKPKFKKLSTLEIIKGVIELNESIWKTKI